MTFAAFDYSPAAREVLCAASRAGVTKESIGEWLNFAARYERRGHRDEAVKCAQKALDIHETWGSQHATYSMAPGTVAKAREIITRCAA